MVTVARLNMIRPKLIGVFKKTVGTKRKAQVGYEHNKKIL